MEWPTTLANSIVHSGLYVGASLFFVDSWIVKKIELYFNKVLRRVQAHAAQACRYYQGGKLISPEKIRLIFIQVAKADFSSRTYLLDGQQLNDEEDLEDGIFLSFDLETVRCGSAHLKELTIKRNSYGDPAE